MRLFVGIVAGTFLTLAIFGGAWIVILAENDGEKRETAMEFALVWGISIVVLALIFIAAWGFGAQFK